MLGEVQGGRRGVPGVCPRWDAGPRAGRHPGAGNFHLRDPLFSAAGSARRSARRRWSVSGTLCFSWGKCGCPRRPGHRLWWGREEEKVVRTPGHGYAVASREGRWLVICLRRVPRIFPGRPRSRVELRRDRPGRALLCQVPSVPGITCDYCPATSFLSRRPGLGRCVERAAARTRRRSWVDVCKRASRLQPSRRGLPGLGDPPGSQARCRAATSARRSGLRGVMDAVPPGWLPKSVRPGPLGLEVLPARRLRLGFSPPRALKFHQVDAGVRAPGSSIGLPRVWITFLAGGRLRCPVPRGMEKPGKVTACSWLSRQDAKKELTLDWLPRQHDFQEINPRWCFPEQSFICFSSPLPL